MRCLRWALFLACSAGMLLATAACGNKAPDNRAAPNADTGRAAGEATGAAHGPIDVCAIVTPEVAAAVLGPLPSQPPAKTEPVGFGIYQCTYVGPKRSGEGAQTIFSRLAVSSGNGKDAADLLQNDADKNHAATGLSGVGDAAKRNADGSFVWARRGDHYCTAQISNGLPRGLTADQAANQLGGLCQRVLAK